MATQCWRIMRACCQLGGNLYCHNEGCLATRAWYQLVISGDQSGDSGLTPGAWSISIINWSDDPSSPGFSFHFLLIDCVWDGMHNFPPNDNKFSLDCVCYPGPGAGHHVSCEAQGRGTSLAFICYLYHNPDIDTGLSWTNNDLSFSQARCGGRSC